MRFTIGNTRLGALLAAALLAVLPSAGRAQQGTIVGTVTDAASGAPIADARVTIVDTRLQSVTNSRGAYRITGVAPGTVPLEVRRIGYRTAVSSVTLEPGQESTSDFQLTVSVVMLEEVVVTGTAGDQQSRAQPATVTCEPAATLAPCEGASSAPAGGVTSPPAMDDDWYAV